jgi:hypothetical protein
VTGEYSRIIYTDFAFVPSLLVWSVNFISQVWILQQGLALDSTGLALELVSRENSLYAIENCNG